jgi:hypothetical protein
MKAAERHRLIIPREVLLVEIERRCQLPDCNWKTRIGLTKAEARAYQGFECERCKGWNQDALAERDVPDWWEEIKVTDLYALHAPAAPEPYEPSEPVKRMSEQQKKRDES